MPGVCGYGIWDKGGREGSRKGEVEAEAAAERGCLDHLKVRA